MIDERIEAAIRKAVAENSQSKQVADGIVKWFENVANGNEDLDEKNDYLRRIEGLFSTVNLSSE